MRCYNIEYQNEYGLELSGVVEIEDADEDFITEDELKEMGLEKTYGFMLYTAKVKRECKKWIAKIPEGKTSIKCTNVELIEALKRNFLDRSTSIQMLLGKNYVGVTRSGPVFKLKPKELNSKGKKVTRAPRLSDWFKLMDLAKIGLAANHIFISGGTLSKEVPDRLKTLTSLKKIVRWYDMENANKTISEYYNERHATEEQMSVIKRMWWKPELVVDFKAGKKK